MFVDEFSFALMVSKLAGHGIARARHSSRFHHLLQSVQICRHFLGGKFSNQSECYATRPNGYPTILSRIFVLGRRSRMAGSDLISWTMKWRAAAAPAGPAPTMATSVSAGLSARARNVMEPNDAQESGSDKTLCLACTFVPIISVRYETGSHSTYIGPSDLFPRGCDYRISAAARDDWH
jgi:hypothetical protein